VSCTAYCVGYGTHRYWSTSVLSQVQRIPRYQLLLQAAPLPLPRAAPTSPSHLSRSAPRAAPSVRCRYSRWLGGPQELLKYTPRAHRDYEVSRPAGPLGFAGGSFRALVARARGSAHCEPAQSVLAAPLSREPNRATAREPCPPQASGNAQTTRSRTVLAPSTHGSAYTRHRAHPAARWRRPRRQDLELAFVKISSVAQVSGVHLAALRAAVGCPPRRQRPLLLDACSTSMTSSRGSRHES
jgi:hypothetical protein